MHILRINEINFPIFNNQQQHWTTEENSRFILVIISMWIYQKITRKIIKLSVPPVQRTTLQSSTSEQPTSTQWSNFVTLKLNKLLGSMFQLWRHWVQVQCFINPCGNLCDSRKIMLHQLMWHPVWWLQLFILSNLRYKIPDAENISMLIASMRCMFDYIGTPIHTRCLIVPNHWLT